MGFHPALEAAIGVNLGTSLSLSRVFGLGVVVCPGLCHSSLVGCCCCCCYHISFYFFFSSQKVPSCIKQNKKTLPILMLDELFKRVCLLMRLASTNSAG